MGAMGEQDRWRKLRDRQIELRDPQKKERKLQRSIAHKRRSRREWFSMRGIFADVPKVITGALIGLALGVALLLVLPYLIQASWVNLAGIAGLVIFSFFGMAFGQAIDARDRLRDI